MSCFRSVWSVRFLSSVSAPLSKNRSTSRSSSGQSPSAIKEPLDIAFLFWSIAVGIVLAAGMIPLAIIGSVIVGVILLLFVNRTPSRNPYIVVLRCADHASETAAKKFLESRTERCIVKGKTAQKGQVELNMEIRLRDDNTDFINELSDMDGVESAVLVSYNGDYMG